MRCASGAGFFLKGAMTSPMVFVSSPSGSPPSKSHFFTSSSPDLPSVNDIISQTSKIRPFKLSTKTAVPSSNAKPSIAETTASSVTRKLNATPRASTPNDKSIDDVEDASIIEISSNVVPKARKPRRKKEVLEKPKSTTKHTTSPTKGQPLKKRRSKAKSSDPILDERLQGSEYGVAPAQESLNAETAQTPASPKPKASRKPAKAKAKKDDSQEPLELELAMVRRLDWTPPAQKSSIVLEPNSIARTGFHSPGDPNETKSFERFLETYKCTDDIKQDVTTNSDEDSSFLKKRKLIEMVATKASNASTSVPAQIPDKSPMKQKAPKKKARTITELATAAYRSENPLESTSATSKDTSNKTENPDEDGNKGKQAKAKPKKRTSKNAKKKPSPPPKPILLPPTEALKEVANQDFIFGTSSQLAVENSPTFLRDLQLAIRDSNQLDVIDLETPLNSDSIEPLEQRPKLWDAGARDVDGELFDLEATTIANVPSQKTASLPKEDDPVGYYQQEENSIMSNCNNFQATGPQGDDPFIDTSDELPSFGLGLKEETNDDPFSDDQLSTGSPAQRTVRSPPVSQHAKSSSLDSESSKQHSSITTHQSEGDHQQPRPAYDLYTDAQLSKEVTSYGFKAVKSRKAKIALLEQCWQSKSRQSHPSMGQTANISTPSFQGVVRHQVPKTPELKKPRGRPRKNSVSASEPQEPPPSAQPPESPARPRGRPKKDAAAGTKPSKATVVKKTKKASLPTGRDEAPTTPKRKPKPITSQAFIEIPDSASDGESDLSMTPQSSPEPTFSPPPPVDLSLSMDDDTDPTLSIDTGDQSALFSYITKAITSAPRATDPANPSWHEKILLYDPIILEDLASWLNCGQLTRVGYDSEVSTGEVKKWCESRSICCLWKVNLRGKERKRY